MMVPRAYRYTSAQAKNSTSRLQNDATSSAVVVEEKAKPKSARQSSGLLPTPSTTSKPMVIPTRTKHRERKSSSPLPLDEKVSSEHDPEAKPASVAAYMAMTVIPPLGKRMTRGSPSKSNAKEGKTRGTSMSSSSPQTWNLLLSAPEDDSFEGGSVGSEVTLGPKSISTESMPSLDEDGGSISSSSNPATPGFGSEKRRNKSLSTSLGQDCALDHPLMARPVSTAIILESDEGEQDSRLPYPSSPSEKSRTSFRSNLTASLRAVRAAAESITDLAPPPRDDLLSRSILSLEVPYASERRPMASSEVPDAALRRYLNPMALSPSELHFHDEPPSPPSCQSAVQMQSYRPGDRRSAHASSPPIFSASESKAQNTPHNHHHKSSNNHLSKDALDTEDALTSSLLPRQREPRENSDFLRVIVLEMNMRKVGKIGDASPGRAKLWLPARVETGKMLGQEKENNSWNEEDAGLRVRKVKSGSRAGKVPARWVAERP